jgi:hypothetical protein
MSTQHTPGPWRVHREGRKIGVLTDSNVIHISTIHTGPIREEADARLMAAAPDLLAALYASKMALLSCMHANVLVDTAFDQVNAAIARATGKEGAK